MTQKEKEGGSRKWRRKRRRREGETVISCLLRDRINKEIVFFMGEGGRKRQKGIWKEKGVLEGVVEVEGKQEKEGEGEGEGGREEERKGEITR